MIQSNDENIEQLIALVEAEATYKMHATSDFEKLSDLIAKKCKTTISPATLKRIWGYADKRNSVRFSTLDILCRFIKQKNWDVFVKNLHDNDRSSMEINKESINSDDLDVKNIISISWGLNKICMLEYLGNMKFRIIKVENSKLKVDDILTCNLIIKGEPLHLNVKRGEESFMYIIGNDANGLTSIQRLGMI